MARKLVVAVCALGVVAAVAFDRFELVRVTPGDDASALIAAAPAGALVVVEPGSHQGPWTIDQPITLVGNGAEVSGGQEVLSVRAAASVRDLTVRGGSTGILVRETNGVSLDRVRTEGADLHGIEIVDASAVVTGAHVSGLQSPYAQGIEIRNSDGRPDSAIRDSEVIGGQEGIVAHVAEVFVSGNIVRDTSMRAIAITEMSDGWVRRNSVTGASGVGLYCGDMSRCEFAGNRVDHVAAGTGGKSSAGWGLVVHYHASASSHNDELAGEAGTTATFIESRLTDRSPLEPGLGSRAVWPAATATIAGLALLLAVYLLVRPRWLQIRGRLMSEPALTALTVAVVTGVAIQTFHMSEHALQLFRVKVDGVPSRGGIVGPVVEAEIIHFVYNSVVLGLMAAIAYGRRHGWGPAVSVRADRLLFAGVLLQGYHWLEHSLKLGQHLVTGRKVNPGAAGNLFDLVHVHFALNLAVYLALLIPCLAYLRRRLISTDASIERSSLRPALRGIFQLHR